MTLEEQMNDILFEIEKGKLYAISSGTPKTLKLAIKKLVSLGLIEPRKNTYDLTKSGYEAIALGSVNKWCTKDQEPKNISNVINVLGDANGSQLGVSSSFQDLEFQNIENKYPNNPATTNQKESTISKLFKFTNHQVIGGLIVGLLLLLITWLVKD